MKIIVPMTPPNILNVRKYKNIYAYRDLRELWRHNIWAIFGVKSQQVLKAWAKIGKRVRVKIHIEHAQLFDPDGLMPAVKVILDSLKKLEYIKDDSEKYIALEVTQEKSSNKITHISIEEIQ